ncbi:MAG TPA: hypothetical protein VH724_13230 [Candidatus Angelobacter sp.]|jgi:hypothetical protein|nr:hypothetical protein [Candidatus Angelobacter sp.]
MSRGWIFAIFTLVDLAIVAGVVWCAFHKLPPSKILTGAAILFVCNGIWLVVMMVRNTPPGAS